jgi:hypothetical protein
MFILENWDSLFASLTETIPIFSSGGGTSSETPNELACGYSVHRHISFPEENEGKSTGDCVNFIPSSQRLVHLSCSRKEGVLA